MSTSKEQVEKRAKELRRDHEYAWSDAYEIALGEQLDQIKAENAALRARVAELERNESYSNRRMR
jgi:hypothetical protein